MMDKKEFFIGAMDRGIRSELNRPLGFGCVTMRGQGAHTDMDFRTFLISGKSLCDSFREMGSEDICDFYSLRRVGLTVEERMLHATGGVNTHKGLLFLLLFLYKAWLDDVAWPEFPAYISRLAAPLLDDYRLCLLYTSDAADDSPPV